jgi:nicotinamidase-related amidase
MYKARWGAFYKTRLEEHLQELGVNTVVFSGCNFPNCPRTSIYEASERDFRVVLVKDAISGLYERGIGELQNIGVTILTTDECVETLRAL